MEGHGILRCAPAGCSLGTLSVSGEVEPLVQRQAQKARRRYGLEYSERLASQLRAYSLPKLQQARKKAEPTFLCYPPAVLLALSVPAGNLRGPQYMEQALAAIHQANPTRLPLTLMFAAYAKTVRLFCHVPPELAAAVTTQLAAHYPDATIERLPEDALTPANQEHMWSADLRLRPDLFPIRRYPQFDDLLNRSTSDPLTGIFAALAPNREAPACIEMTVWPAGRRRVTRARKTLRRLALPFFRTHPTLARAYAMAATSRSSAFRLSARLLVALAWQKPPASLPALPSSTRTHDREDEVQAAADKLGRHLFEVRIRLLTFAPHADAASARARLHRIAGAFGPFTVPRMAVFRLSAVRHRPARRSLRPRRGFLLSAEELATLWHPATATVSAPAMQRTESRELEPPPVLPLPAQEPGVAVLGRTKFRSRREVFGIRSDDRRRHLAIIGKTGMGKTTLLHKLITSDINAGCGLALIDPHGDLCDAILDCMPSRPFSFETLPPPAPDPRRIRSTIIRRTSRHRYSRPAVEVDAEIERMFISIA